MFEYVSPLTDTVSPKVEGHEAGLYEGKGL